MMADVSSRCCMHKRCSTAAGTSRQGQDGDVCTQPSKTGSAGLLVDVPQQFRIELLQARTSRRVPGRRRRAEARMAAHRQRQGALGAILLNRMHHVRGPFRLRGIERGLDVFGTGVCDERGKDAQKDVGPAPQAFTAKTMGAMLAMPELGLKQMSSSPISAQQRLNSASQASGDSMPYLYPVR
jgi:hypothetical protein